MIHEPILVTKECKVCITRWMCPVDFCGGDFIQSGQPTKSDILSIDGVSKITIPHICNKCGLRSSAPKIFPTVSFEDKVEDKAGVTQYEKR